ncbi:MAG: replication initiation protein [Rhodanobacter sp.]
MQQASLAFDQGTLFEPAEQNLRKATGAIHISNVNISALQRKLMNGLLYCAAPELANFNVRTHKVLLSLLARVVGFNSNNTASFKATLVELVGIRVGWNILQPDGSNEWGVAALLADAVIRHGELTYSFAPQLRERLASPDHWAPIDMSVVRKFSTGAGIAMYENLEPYRGVGQTPFFKLAMLRELLGASGESYDEFKALNRSVIKPAIDEVNKHSRFHVEAELKRERRQVVAVKLHITQPARMVESAASPEDTLLAQAFDERLLEQLTLDYCLGKDTARKVMNDHSADRLIRVMEYVGDRYVNGQIQQTKIAPYFLATLAKWDDGATNSRLTVKPKATASSGQKGNIDPKLRAAEDRAKALRETRKAEAEKRLQLLSVEERVALESDFEEFVREHHSPVLKILQNDGVTHPMIKGAFSEYLQKRLLDEHATAVVTT